MNIFEYLARGCVKINFGSQIVYGQDHIKLDNLIVFPTVCFKLLPTGNLIEIADSIRKEVGFKPMFEEGLPKEEKDQFGWYDFYIGINLLDSVLQVDHSIDFVVVNSIQSDNGETYRIELGEYERQVILDVLDRQCVDQLGKSCSDLIKEAEGRMKVSMSA